jgi:glucokinase
LFCNDFLITIALTILNNMEKFAIGIDVGGTTTKFGLVTRNGNILVQDRIPTNTHEDVADFVHELYQKIEPMMQQVGGKENIVAIGMGAPNGNFYKGTIEYAPNLIWKGVVPMADLMQQRFGLNCRLTNDANAAAMGEYIYGCAKGVKHFITITLGTGVGSGIVIDGKVVYGHDGFAGELGHNIVIPNGRLHWGTGFKGSLEAYASATGMRLTALELLDENKEEDSMLRNYEAKNIDAKIIFECAEKGDRMSQQVFEETGKILGLALANFVMFSSPELIVLFGGPTKAGDLILKPTQQSMEDNLLPIFKNKVKVLISPLPESDAAILGASSLVWGD